MVLMKRTIKELADENEWVPLARVGQILRAINPTFDALTHGSKNPHLLIESEPDRFDLKSNEYKSTIRALGQAKTRRS